MIRKYIKHQEAKEREEEQRQGKMMGYCNMSFEDGSTIMTEHQGAITTVKGEKLSTI